MVAQIDRGSRKTGLNLTTAEIGIYSLNNSTFDILLAALKELAEIFRCATSRIASRNPWRSFPAGMQNRQAILH